MCPKSYKNEIEQKIILHILRERIVLFEDLCSQYPSFPPSEIKSFLKNLILRYRNIKFLEDTYILAVTSFQKDSSFLFRLDKNINEKFAIARYVVQHVVNDSDYILLGGGSTELLIAVQIILQSRLNLRIAVPNIVTANLLMNRINSVEIVSGTVQANGQILRRSNWFEFQNRWFDKCFLSFRSLSFKRGVSSDEERIEFISEAISCTRGKIYFVGDHTKIGKNLTNYFIPFNDPVFKDKDYEVITDNHFLDDESKERVENEKNRFDSNHFTAIPFDIWSYLLLKKLNQIELFSDNILEMGVHGNKNYVIVNGIEIKGFQTNESLFVRLLLLAAAKKYGAGWLNKEYDLKCTPIKYYEIDELRKLLKVSRLNVPNGFERDIIESNPTRNKTVRFSFRPENISIDSSITQFTSLHQARIKEMIREGEPKILEKMWYKNLEFHVQLWAKHTLLVKRAVEEFLKMKFPRDEEFVKSIKSIRETQSWTDTQIDSFIKEINGKA